MVRKYLLVDITKDTILIVKKVLDSERVGVIKAKTKTQELWTVSSYASARNIIEEHNQKTEPANIDKSVYSPTVLIWDWEKVDEENKEAIKEFYKVQDWYSIFELHNSLSLTTENYCCDGYIYKVEHNIQQAIEKGIIV